MGLIYSIWDNISPISSSITYSKGGFVSGVTLEAFMREVVLSFSIIVFKNFFFFLPEVVFKNLIILFD